MSDALRVLLGAAVFVGAFTVAAELEKASAKARHERYVQCVTTGENPVICSIQSVFGRYE